MRWRIILEEFGPKNHYIYGVDNIVSDTLSRFSYTSIDKYEPSTKKDKCCANELLRIGRVENKAKCFSLDLLNVQREQQKELININPKLSK